MDAAQLVEQRKSGSITQEQFFIALNELRRTNSGLESRRSSSSGTATAATATSAEKAAGAPPNVDAIREAEAYATQQVRPDLCSFRSTSVAVHDVLDESIAPPKVAPHNDTRQTPEPPSEIASPGTQAATDDGSAANGDTSRRQCFVRENHIQHVGRGNLSTARHNTPPEFTRSISPRKQAISSPTDGGGREKVRSSDNDEQADSAQRKEDSAWLVSPRGETRSRRLLRKIPGDKCSESRSASAINGQDSSVVGGKSTARGASSTLRSGGETESSRMMKPQWRLAGGGGSSPPYGQQIDVLHPRVRSQPVTRPLSPKASPKTAQCAAVGNNCNEPGGDSEDKKRLLGNAAPRRIRGSRAQQSSPVRSTVEEEERRSLTSGFVRRRRVTTGQRDLPVGSTADGAMSNTSTYNDASQQQGWLGSTISRNAGEDASIRSLPSGDSRRRGYRRNREKDGTAPRAAAINSSRRLSGSASTGCLDCSGRVFSVRCDRYGYPLHEKEGIGSSWGVRGGRSLFSPKIKGLPEFYRSRPTRTTTVSSRLSFERAGGGDGDASQSNPVYKRTTRWLAQSGELRLLKMAQREEQEMGACTFQPNAARKQSRTSSRPGTVESLIAGTSGHAGGGGDGNAGVVMENSRGQPTKKGRGKGKDVDFCGSGEGVGQRLFEESKRLSERRFENEERKRMGEEEAHARTCTFKPSLSQGSAARSMDVRARYMDITPTPVAPVQQDTEQLFSFRPKIVGLRPRMTRAREYVGVDVSERLYRACPNRQQRPVGYSGEGDEIYDEECRRGHYSSPWEGWGNRRDCGISAQENAGDAMVSPRSERLGDSRRRFYHGSSFDRRRDRDFFGKQDTERRYSEGHSGGSPARRMEFPSRPRSAPAAGRERGDWGHRPREISTRDAPGGVEGGFSCREGSGVARGGSRRQTSISFKEFLARQAHSQASARQRLSRLTRMQSPSFTPKLSRGSRRIVERNGAGGAGGGCFEDRLKVTARRRQRDRKAAVSAARRTEETDCTFSPELTVRSRVARSRSARELSIGDSAVRAAKQRMARAREQTRLLSDPAAGDDGGFTPRLETKGDNLAPLSSSRLRLADELDTYIDRIQEAAMDREEVLFQQRRRALAEEAQGCTFQPIVKECPDLVRRTAAGMRGIREFRRNEALSINGPARPVKPGWR